MEFLKMEAKVVFNMKDGTIKTYNYKEYNLRVTHLVSNIMSSCNDDLHLRGVDIFGSEIESFEILNYEELLEFENILNGEEN